MAAFMKKFVLFASKFIHLVSPRATICVIVRHALCGRHSPDFLGAASRWCSASCRLINDKMLRTATPVASQLTCRVSVSEVSGYFLV